MSVTYIGCDRLNNGPQRYPEPNPWNLKLLLYVQNRLEVVLKGLEVEHSLTSRDWGDIFKLLNKGNYQPRILYLLKVSFKNEGEILKNFPDKQKLSDIITIRLTLQEMLKGALQI